MATRDDRALGIELITGKHGGSWGTRAAKLRALLSTLFGPEAPNARALPEPRAKAEHRLRTVRATPKRRGGAEEAATSFLDALVNRDFDALHAKLADKPYMLWPDGTLARHDRDELIAALRAREGTEAKVIPEHVASYASAELRSVVARGIAEAIEALIDTPSAIVTTMKLDSPRGSLGGATVLLAEDARGWRALNLPFAGIDDAYRASAAASKDEDEAVRVADRVVRHLSYGHEKHVRSLRNVMMDRVMSGDMIEPAEKLAERAGEGPHRLQAADLVFLGTELSSFEQLIERVGRAKADLLKRKAKEAWTHPFEKLKTKLVAVRTAKLDASTLEVDLATEQKLFALLIAVKDRPEDEARWRLAALFL